MESATPFPPAAEQETDCLEFPPACPSDAHDDDRITLIGLIFETAHGLRRELLGTVEGELGVAGQSFDILLRLLRSPETSLRMSDLAAQTGLSPSGLTRAIDRLVEADFLERMSCASDRRGAYARLTPLGRQRTEAALCLHRLDIDRILDATLAADEEATLLRLLRALRDRVQPDAALVTTGGEHTVAG